MLRLNFIRAAVLSVSLLGLCASALQARDLTPREQSVCRSLKTCMDIASRHTASEFDYGVLELEFKRFGPRGRQALFSLLKSEDGHADVAKLIAKLSLLTPAERQAVTQSWIPERAPAYLPLLLDGHPCLLYTSPSPRDQRGSRMPSSA